MAKGEPIKRLAASLTLETGGFEKGAKLAESGLARMSRQFGTIGTTLAASVAAMAGSLGYMARNSIDAADEMSKAAVKIGIGTEELSRLRYAADLSGVSFEGLEKSLLILNRNMAGIGGESKKVSEAFAQMGISTRNTDGSLKSSTRVLKEMADVFANMPDGAQKSALAMAVLGKSGGDMIPLINGGSQALQQLTDEASQFGIVIDQETGLKAEQFNDNLSRLQGVFSALATRIAADMLPALVQFTDWLVRNQDHISGVVRSLTTFTSGMGQLIASLGNASFAFNSAFSPAVSAADDRLRGFVRSALAAQGPIGAVVGYITSLGVATKSQNPFGSAVSTMMTMGEQALRNAKAMQGMASSFEGARASAGNLSAGIQGASAATRALSSDADRTAFALQGLMDRLFPAEARARKLREELTLIDGSAMADDQKASARFRLGTENLGTAAVSRDLLGTGPLVDFSAKMEELQKELGGLADATKVQTVRIAESFGEMAQNSIRALDNMVNSIKGGGFLDILGSALNLFLQVGGSGLFGKKLAGSINAARIPFFAQGTNSAPGGLAWVGERGPELVNLPRGSQVISNRDLRRANEGARGVDVRVGIDPRSGNVTAFVDSRLSTFAPAIASAGAAMAQAQAGASARRRVR